MANGTGSGAGAGPAGRDTAARPSPGTGRPPGGAPLGSRLVGAFLAVVGVALLVTGLITLRGRSPDQRPPGAAPGATSSPAGTTSPPVTPTATPTVTVTAAPPSTSSTAPGTTSRPAPTTTPAPPPAARAPLTVLNNSKVIGLGERAAEEARGKGWRVALIGNFAGRIPLTTIYFTPGDTAGKRAAYQFAAEFPGVQRVFPRYEGLPPTPHGIVLVVTRDWPDP